MEHVFGPADIARLGLRDEHAPPLAPPRAGIPPLVPPHGGVPPVPPPRDAIPPRGLNPFAGGLPAEHQDEWDAVVPEGPGPAPQGVGVVVRAMGRLTMQLAANQAEQQAAHQRQYAELQATLLAQQQLNHQLQQQYQVLVQGQRFPVDEGRRIRNSACDRIAVFTGAPEDRLDDWLDSLERVAVVEGWTEADRRRVAIIKLSGVAARWHDQAGHAFPDWQAWMTQIRAAFEPKLTMADWGQMVEGRKQQIGESGVQYALDKMKICRRCPIDIPEADLIPYLIRGLNRPEHIAVFMATPPRDLTEFLATVRRLEAMGQLPQADPKPVVQTTQVPTTPLATQVPLNELSEALKVFGSRLVEQLGQVIEPLARALPAAGNDPQGLRRRPLSLVRRYNAISVDCMVIMRASVPNAPSVTYRETYRLVR